MTAWLCRPASAGASADGAHRTARSLLRTLRALAALPAAAPAAAAPAAATGTAGAVWSKSAAVSPKLAASSTRPSRTRSTCVASRLRANAGLCVIATSAPLYSCAPRAAACEAPPRVRRRGLPLQASAPPSLTCTSAGRGGNATTPLGLAGMCARWKASLLTLAQRISL